MKETYESMKLLLEKIKYDEFKWMLCDYLKVVALLLGLHLGYTKFCCSLCEWDSRDKLDKLWPKRKSLTPEEKNFVNPPLLPEKIYSPPLHIELGLIKNFVKGMDKTGRELGYVRNKFLNVSDVKIKADIFI
jgi:hypothetical protein